MHRLSWLLAVALALFVTLPAHAAGKWTRLRSEHFEFVGDASEGDIRRTAQHLEEFRAALSRALAAGAVASPVPTVVIVFKNDGSLTPYKPQFQGRLVDVAGFFQGGEPANYIVINAEAGNHALRVIFHEYAHFLTGNTAGLVPVWVNEGLAGFYETFEERNGGRSVLIGLPHLDHLRLLQNSTFMPLAELLAVSIQSPVYNEGDRRRVFYAESWALVHYLTLGNPTRASQLSAYLANLKRGAQPDAAFRDAFAVDVGTLERELREYLHRVSFPQLSLDFAARVSGSSTARSEAIDDIEASAYLGDLLARMRRTDEARTQLRGLLDRNARSGRAARALGLLELEAGNISDARSLLERAAALAPDDGAVQSGLGRVLLASAQDQETDESREAVLQRARAVLSRAVDLAPDAADTVALLGRAEWLAGGDPARAASLLERAVGMAPASESYRLTFANMLLQQGEYARATAQLGPLLANGSRPDVRDLARQLLTEIARKSHGVRMADAAPPASTEALPGSTTSALSPGDSPAPGGGTVLDLRLLAEGETRVLGLFASVECRPKSIVLHVDVESRSLRLEATRFDDVEFITYTSATPGAVSCGPIQPPARVLATYRIDHGATSEPGIDGQAAAIEVLPDGYTLR